MIQKILYKKKLLAMIVQENKFYKPGVKFITPNNLTLQLGFMSHKSQTYIKPHTHKNYLRKIKKTTEILLIKKGSLRVDFYSKRKYLFSKVVNKGKILILLEGSHGFKMSDPVIRTNCSDDILKNHIKFIKSDDPARLKHNENGATDRLFTNTKMYGANIIIKPHLSNQLLLIEHELGHALGLNHSQHSNNVMYHERKYYANVR